MLVLDKVSFEDRLGGISVRLGSAQQVHILGANGAGKSTLLHALAGGLELSSGHVQFLGHPLSDWSLSQLASMRCLLQQQQSSPFGLSVAESLAFFGAPAILPDEVEYALEIASFLHRSLHALSGGELRRIHLARVMLQIWPAIEGGRGLVLLDEPDQGLDFRHQHRLFAMLSALSEKGNLIVCTHHNLNLAHEYADTVLLLKSGQLMGEGRVAEVMQPQTLQNVFDCRVARVNDSMQNVYFRTF